jgi:hypothetical protein
MRYLIATALLATSFQASAELDRQQMNVVCGPTEELIAQLRDKYGEAVVWSGHETNNNLVTIWGNVDKNTFTIVKTSPDGKISCAISAGTPDTEI